MTHTSFHRCYSSRQWLKIIFCLEKLSVLLADGYTPFLLIHPSTEALVRSLLLIEDKHYSTQRTLSFSLFSRSFLIKKVENWAFELLNYQIHVTRQLIERCQFHWVCELSSRPYRVHQLSVFFGCCKPILGHWWQVPIATHQAHVSRWPLGRNPGSPMIGHGLPSILIK